MKSRLNKNYVAFLSLGHYYTTSPYTISKTHRCLLLISFVLLLSSFKKDVFLNSMQTQGLHSRTEGQTHLKPAVPFKGAITLTIEDNGQLTGTGVGTHLGKFDILVQDDESNFPSLTGTVTITAANGDQLFVTHTGRAEVLDNNMLKVTLENMITGGTGRFTDATGSFTINAIANENTGTASATFTGKINY